MSRTRFLKIFCEKGSEDYAETVATFQQVMIFGNHRLRMLIPPLPSPPKLFEHFDRANKNSDGVDLKDFLLGFRWAAKKWREARRTFKSFLILCFSFLFLVCSYWKNKLSTANDTSNNLVLFFSLFDTGGNGQMSPEEFARMMRYCLSLRFDQSKISGISESLHRLTPPLLP